MTTKRPYATNTKKRTYTVTDEVHAELRRLGQGNASRGIREAVKAAQDYTPRQHLPENCRERLRLEGKAYPKSGCSSCGKGGMTGCPHKQASPHPRALIEMEGRGL